jgi:uncharacterized protein YkwD
VSLRTRGRRRPEFDRLDTRTLPAGGVRAAFAQGVLAVAGDDRPNAIVVDVLPSSPTGQPLRGVIVVEGVAAFPLAAVQQVVVAGFGGNDAILIRDAGSTLPVQVFGGNGDDRIRTANSRDWIDGGPGRDQINGVWDNPAPVKSTSLPPAPTPSPALDPQTSMVVEIISLTNRARTAAGLAPLTVNPKLVQAAQIHVGDMARLDRMLHDLPGAVLPTLQERARFVGYNYSWMGENIAYNFVDGYAVMIGWMDSWGHRENILNPNFTEIGVAVASNSRGQLYFCQVFGQQQSG